MDSLLQDLKFATRQLLKDRSFLITAGLTLALCIGANATIFSIINSVILRPLPIPEPDRVVRMWNAYPGATGGDERGANGVPDYFDRREMTDVFAEVAAFGFPGRALEIAGQAERVRTMEATPSFFTIMQVAPQIGRAFTEEEATVGNQRVAMLSHDLWQQLSGGDPRIVDSDLTIDGEVYKVVGVMPQGYEFLGQEARLFTPLAYAEEDRQNYHSNNWAQVARLAEGVSLEQAQAQVDALNDRNSDLIPELKPLLEAAGFHTVIALLADDLVADVRDTLTMLWGGVGFVLLIGIVNVANLMLVRSTGRTRELATRFALGAGRWRVVRQLVTESLLLTMLGGVAGLGLGWLGLQGMELLSVDALPRANEISMDVTAAAFTLGLALLVGVVVSLIPVASVARISLSAAFREEGRSGTSGRGTRLLRKGLVSAQVAFALILLLGAGLLLSSFQQLLSVDTGFEPEGVISGRVRLPEAQYAEQTDVYQFAMRTLEEVRAVPGVEAAGIGTMVPFEGSMSSSVIFAEGYVPPEGESPLSPAMGLFTPGYFEALGVPIVAGRAFDDSDTGDGEPVIIIDQTLAAKFFPDGDAVGRRMWRPNSAEDMLDPANAFFMRIVGVAAPIKIAGIADTFDAVGAYYLPLSQPYFSMRGLSIVARTSGDPVSLTPGLRQAVAEIDPSMPVYDMIPMTERVRESLADRRAPMLLTGMFAVTALFLAAVGIYGALGYLVAMRRREIGIRVALGSGVRRIFRTVLREGLTIIGIGLVAGLLGAQVLSRLIESQLYGVGVTDPLVLAGVVAVLALVGLFACLLPARRAAHIDPVVALQD